MTSSPPSAPSPLSICSRFLKKALVKALRAAADTHQAEVDPAHLLLGLSETPGSLATEMLSRGKFEAQTLRTFLHTLTPSITTTIPALAPMSREILERAAAIAHRRQSPYLGTEHVLKIILDNPSPTLTAFHLSHPWDMDPVRAQLELIIKGGQKLAEMAEQFMDEQHEADPLGLPPALTDFAKDLTDPENEDELAPVIGRDQEIERMMHILCRRTKNNPVLLGDPGVGKTAVVEGLAKRILRGDVPPALKGRRIVSLDVGSLIAGTMFRGEFESRLKAIVDELISHPEIIAFIDELHTIVGAGNANGSADAANLLKPALSRGEIRCIGATTVEEYRRFIEIDGALERRFQPITVREPSPAETKNILTGLKGTYEAFHGLTITDEAIEAAVALSERYVTDRFLPDKAIDLIDEAASRVRLQSTKPDVASQLMETERAENTAAERKDNAIHKDRFDEAKRWRAEEKKLGVERLRLKTALKNRLPGGPLVDRIAVAHVLTAWTNIPVLEQDQSDQRRLQEFETELARLVAGHEPALKTIADTIRRGRLGLSNRHRPLASFLLTGPSGAGKTTIAKAIAKTLFGDERALLTLDMTEYAEGFTTSKLIGAPAGYVGYKESGLLTERVRRAPYQVIIFDELDRAHREVLQLLQQILDEGSLRDATGRLINFRQTVIVATANPERNESAPVGFGGNAGVEAIDELRIRELLSERMGADLVNRFDALLPLRALGEPELLTILERELATLNERLTARAITVTIPATAKQALIAEAMSGADSVAGGRMVTHFLRRVVENQLATHLLTTPTRRKKSYRLHKKTNHWELV